MSRDRSSPTTWFPSTTAPSRARSSSASGRDGDRAVLAMSVQTIADLAGGRLSGGVHGARGVTGVTIDTRRPAPGELFVALPGERTAGHAFLADPAGRGAASVPRRESAP